MPKIIYTGEDIDRNNHSIFLSGPTYRVNKEENFDSSESWRKKALKIFQYYNYPYIIYVPEYRNNKKPYNLIYENQIDWEISAMDSSDVILFWIPRDLDNLPAFTTNVEFGLFLDSGKIVIGAPKEAPKNEYLKYRCKLLGIPWYNTLEECIDASLNKIIYKRSDFWFTSDTHFGQQRTLELHKRPFNNVKEMDNTLIKNWNSCITNNDIVYHMGDFGDPLTINKLNGKIIYIVPGKSYDDEVVLETLKKDNRVKVIKANNPTMFDGVLLSFVHEPLEALDRRLFYLFGHIHNTQKVKINGLNVGVDCHNYKPINLETVLFYQKAIYNYYDKNVFIDILGL